LRCELRRKDAESFVFSIKLLMVDEIHLIADETRGATLEATVVRMKSISSIFQQQQQQQQAAMDEGERHALRIVGVSATVPNIQDVGEWIGAPASNICSFGPEFRPVPLTVQAISGGSKFTNPFVFDKGLGFRIPDLLRQHSNGRPALVFCATRASTSAAATQLARESASQLISGAQRQLLQENVDQINACQDKGLRQCLVSGVGFHHGSLAQADRRIVEHLFVSRALFCLFATSTLAVGANLPAYLVIIKSTIQYRTVAGVAGWCEYDSHSIQQMAGRAGRPGFDTEGKCIILTQEHNVNKYRDIMHVQTLIESRLPSQLTEHLNSEIVLRSIKDIESMLCWASSTFFSVRAKKVPAKYFPQLKSTGADASAHVDRHIRDLMMQGYTALANAAPPLCISTDEDGMSFKSTELGCVMAKYCVAFKTMETMARLLTAKSTMAEMIECLSEAEEFLDFKPRNDEKKFLEDANKVG
jgi:ATP-dependent DNA helicase HFM1/MER3